MYRSIGSYDRSYIKRTHVSINLVFKMVKQNFGGYSDS